MEIWEMSLHSRGTTTQPLVKTYIGRLVQKAGLSLVEIYIYHPPYLVSYLPRILPRVFPHIVPIISLGIEASEELEHIPK